MYSLKLFGVTPVHQMPGPQSSARKKELKKQKNHYNYLSIHYTEQLSSNILTRKYPPKSPAHTQLPASSKARVYRNGDGLFAETKFPNPTHP